MVEATVILMAIGFFCLITGEVEGISVGMLMWLIAAGLWLWKWVLLGGGAIALGLGVYALLPAQRAKIRNWYLKRKIAKAERMQELSKEREKLLAQYQDVVNAPYREIMKELDRELLR